MAQIRNAKVKDIKDILRLLADINRIHHDLRPDLFRLNTKYTEEELSNIIKNNSKIIFVYEDNNKVYGYAINEVIDRSDNQLFTPIKTLYLDDLCVDESYRGKGIGEMLYKHIKEYAKSNGFYNITLNVWNNNKALKFYEKMGLKLQKMTLEEIL